MWGWGIELVYLVCVLGEVPIHGRLQGWFKTGAFIVAFFGTLGLNLFWSSVTDFTR